MRKTTAISLGVLVLAASGCSQDQPEEMSHCVDENDVVVADEVCTQNAEQNPVIIPGGVVHHYRLYYGGYRFPQPLGTRLSGGGYVRRPGAVYVTPRVYTTRRITVPSGDGVSHGDGTTIGHGGFGGEGHGFGGGGGGG